MKDYLTRLAIEELLVSFFWKIDRKETHDIATLFTEDAQVIMPDTSAEIGSFSTVKGHEALSKKWSNRPDDYISRHVYTNLQVREVSENEAESRCIGIAYRHTGKGVGQPIPVIVNDIESKYQLGSDGKWRFKEKRVIPLFIGQDLYQKPR